MAASSRRRSSLTAPAGSPPPASLLPPAAFPPPAGLPGRAGRVVALGGLADPGHLQGELAIVVVQGGDAPRQLGLAQGRHDELEEVVLRLDVVGLALDPVEEGGQAAARSGEPVDRHREVVKQRVEEDGDEAGATGEVVGDQRAADVGLVGDRLDRQAFEAALGEHSPGRLEDAARRGRQRLHGVVARQSRRALARRGVHAGAGRAVCAATRTTDFLGLTIQGPVLASTTSMRPGRRFHPHKQGGCARTARLVAHA